MKSISKFLTLLFLLPVLGVLNARAQHGRIEVSSLASSSTKGAQTNSQLPQAYFHVYLLGIGSTPNSTPMSMISCDNDDGGVTVGSDDGDTSCYAVADSNGNFDLTGLYYGFGDGTGCTTGAAQNVYVEIREGNVASNPNVANALVAVPPSAWNCDYIYNNSSSIFFDVTDFTNVMAAFALGPFANFINPSGPNTFDGLSASGTAGKAVLMAAFDTIQNYVPVNTGHYTGSDPTLIKQFNTIADVLSACENSVNSSYPLTSTGCTTLSGYTADNGFTGTRAPIDLFQMAASMAQDPTHNVTNEFNLSPPTPPWQPTFSSAPGSWTVNTSGAPVLSGISAVSAGSSSTTAGKKSTSATISGTGFRNPTTGVLPVIAVGFQAVTALTCNTGGTSCTFTLPATPAQSAVGVYVNGLVSNFLPFKVTSN